MSCLRYGQPFQWQPGTLTLAHLLSGLPLPCLQGGRVTGEVKVNGHPQVASTFTRVSGYVEQVRGRRLNLCHSML